MPPGQRQPKNGGRKGSPGAAAKAARKAGAVRSASKKAEWDSGYRVSDSKTGKSSNSQKWLAPTRTPKSNGARQGSPGQSANSNRNRAAWKREDQAERGSAGGWAKDPAGGRGAKPIQKGRSTWQGKRGRNPV